MGMCRIIMTLGTTKPQSVRNSSVGGPCSNSVLSCYNGESGIVRTCSRLLLLCGKSHEMWGGGLAQQLEALRVGQGQERMMKVPLASRRDPDRLRWWCHARTHAHTHISCVLCRCSTPFCLVLCWSQTDPNLYRVPNIRRYCPTV
jgi:hypothetical protein